MLNNHAFYVIFNSEKEQPEFLNHLIVKKIFALLYKKNNIFLMNDIFTILEKYPDIQKINSMYIKNYSHLEYKKEKTKISKI